MNESPTAALFLEALARRAVDGDGRAVRELCEQLEAPVFRFCLRMLAHPQDAEDAAQDVLIKVVTNLSSFRGDSALTTWVYRIAARHALACAKTRSEARALDERAFAALLEQAQRLDSTLPAPTPEDLVMLKEVRLSCTQGMLLVLAREERLAIVLVDLLGFDGPEAATIAEVSDDAFRQRLGRGRARLVAFLQGQCGLVSESAPCRCERLLPLRVAKGLTATSPGRLAPLSCGDLATAVESTATAMCELAEVRAIAKAFQRDGAFRAPSSLRRRILGALPTLLRADGS